MPTPGSWSAEQQPGRGAWFAAATAVIARKLPFGLARVVAPSMVGFAIINSVTFAADLTLLIVLHRRLGWPVPISVTLAYLAASGLSYLLNRSLNFRSHGALVPQAGVYAAVITVNYLAWILGVGAGLAAAGVDYRVARIAAGACEAGYMYAAMRWVVFRDVRAGQAGVTRGWPSRGSGRARRPPPASAGRPADPRRARPARRDRA